MPGFASRFIFNKIADAMDTEAPHESKEAVRAFKEYYVATLERPGMIDYAQ